MRKTPVKVNETNPRFKGDGWDQKRVNAAHVKRLRRCVRNLATLPVRMRSSKQSKELAKMEKWV